MNPWDFDLIDILLPGAFCRAGFAADSEQRTMLSKAIGAALDRLPDEAGEEFFATADDMELIAACTKHWRKGTAPDSLIGELRERSRAEGSVGLTFEILLNGVQSRLN